MSAYLLTKYAAEQLSNYPAISSTFFATYLKTHSPTHNAAIISTLHATCYKAVYAA